MPLFVSLLRNSVASIVTNVVNRLGNILIFILILRYLGVGQGGIYTLGLSYFFISSRFAFWGLDHLLTREVAKDKENAARYFGNYLFARIGLAAIILALFAIFISLTSYDIETKVVIGLMLLSILPENINNLCWAGFASFEAFHYTTISVFVASLTQIGLGGLLLWLGYGLRAMALVFLLNNLVAMVINLTVLRRGFIKRWERPELSFIRSQLIVALPFLFISIFFILGSRIDTVVMSFLTNNEEIGYYAAAMAVIVALSMIPQGYRIAILPILARNREEGHFSVDRIYQQSFKYLLLMGLPLTAATALLATDLIPLIYRQELPEAVPALRILSISIVFTFINVLNARLLIVFDRQSLSARFMAASTLLNVVINLILVGALGAIGAAIAMVSSTATLTIINRVAVREFVPGFRGLTFFWRPLVATGLMAVVIWQLAQVGFWAQVLIGAITYLAILFLLGTFTAEERRTVQQTIRSWLTTKSGRMA